MSSSDDENAEEWPYPLEEATCLVTKNHTHVISYKMPFARVLGKLTPSDQAHKRHRLGLRPPYPSNMGDSLLDMEAKNKLKNCQRIFYFNLEEALRRPGREEEMAELSGDAKRSANRRLYLHQQRQKEIFEAKFRKKYEKGHGSYGWPDKRSYDGQWNNGDPHGVGCMIWPTEGGGKDKYDGQFKDGQSYQKIIRENNFVALFIGFAHGKGTKRFTDEGTEITF